MATEKKYKLGPKSVRTGLRRVIAIRDFADVKKGSVGGWVRSEENLSHEGTCWIYEDAFVYDKALVSEKAKVFGDAWVFGNAKVRGEAKVGDDASVYDKAQISDKAFVFGEAKVYGSALVMGHSQVLGTSVVSGEAIVEDPSIVQGHSDLPTEQKTEEKAMPTQTKKGKVRIVSREKTFEISFSGGVHLRVSEIFPDGEVPENPTVHDVLAVMKKSCSSKVNLMTDWSLEECLDISVTEYEEQDSVDW